MGSDSIRRSVMVLVAALIASTAQIVRADTSEISEVVLTESQLDLLVGKYRFTASGNLNEIVRDGKRLRFKSPAYQMDVQLIPTSPTTFRQEDYPRTQYEFDLSGPKVKVIITTNGKRNGQGIRE